MSDVVDIARGWLGTPYVHQASVKGAGRTVWGCCVASGERFTAVSRKRCRPIRRIGLSRNG